MAFDPFAQKSAPKKRPTVGTDNFLEALKDIGGGVVRGIAKDVIQDSAKSIANTALNANVFKASGDIAPGSSLDMEQMQKEHAEQLAKAEHRRLHQLKTKEEIVFSAKEEQTKREIEGLKEELKKLASELGEVAHDVQVAALQETAHPGTYHLSFFEHLKSLIKTLREKLSDSGTWLQTATSRNSKKKGYWGMAKSQGTSFTQNNERTLATQSG